MLSINIEFYPSICRSNKSRILKISRQGFGRGSCIGTVLFALCLGHGIHAETVYGVVLVTIKRNLKTVKAVGGPLC